MKRIVLPILIPLLLGGCGSSGSNTDGAAAAAGTSGGEGRPEQADDGLEVEGLLGHISAASVERGMARGTDAFLRCFSARYDEVDVLGGEVELAFRIKRDGSVRWVYLRSSSVGDRATERCLLREAGRLRFDRPEGGEAEFSAPLALDPPDDVRPPVAWPASRVEAAVRRGGPELRAACGLGDPSLRVTAYVAPGGQVIAAGASADLPDVDGALDCVAEGVMQWSLPDPGSYPSKVTFSLP